MLTVCQFKRVSALGSGGQTFKKNSGKFAAEAWSFLGHIEKAAPPVFMSGIEPPRPECAKEQVEHLTAVVNMAETGQINGPTSPDLRAVHASRDQSGNLFRGGLHYIRQAQQ